MPRAEGPAGPSRITVAPAKVNLALHVTGRRADGYHLLDMLVAFAAVGDEVRWEPGGEACALAVEDQLDRPEPVPGNTENLAWRALALAGRRSPVPLTGTVRVVKALPSGAGLGGGSSDAAAVLRLLLGDGCFENDGVRQKALALGADVPVCMAGYPARVRGIGEVIEPVTMAGPLPAVLVWPGRGLSTPAVFRARAGGFDDPIPSTALRRLTVDPLAAIAGLRNGLEEAAATLLPGVGEARRVLQDSAGCRVARMSGSGSTVIGYFESTDSADAAAASLAAAYPGWWVRATVLSV
jgi:4-diphosphocytidyl-2-C-methyl-D-erythritol kinase